MMSYREKFMAVFGCEPEQFDSREWDDPYRNISKFKTYKVTLHSRGTRYIIFDCCEVKAKNKQHAREKAKRIFGNKMHYYSQSGRPIDVMRIEEA